MAKRKVESQIVNLTPDHYKSRIAPISFHAGGMSHTVEKLSTKATPFLQTSSQSEVCKQSYEPPKSRESQLREFWDSDLRVPRQNDIWVLVPWLGTKYTIRGKVVASLSLGCGEFCEPMFAYSSSVHQKCSDYALTNLLFGYASPCE